MPSPTRQFCYFLCKSKLSPFSQLLQSKQAGLSLIAGGLKIDCIMMLIICGGGQICVCVCVCFHFKRKTMIHKRSISYSYRKMRSSFKENNTYKTYSAQKYTHTQRTADAKFIQKDTYSCTELLTCKCTHTH